jgi:hypothetical protein
MNSAHIESLRDQLDKWKRNLAHFKLEEAKMAGHISAALATDIEEAEKHIRNLERAIDLAEEGQVDDNLMATYNSIFGMVAHIDRRIRALEDDINRHGEDIESIKQKIDPPVRVVIGRTVFWLSFLMVGILWLVFESRTYMLANPTQAIITTLALFAFAFLVRWLPEEPS